MDRESLFHLTVSYTFGDYSAGLGYLLACWFTAVPEWSGLVEKATDSYIYGLCVIRAMPTRCPRDSWAKQVIGQKAEAKKVERHQRGPWGSHSSFMSTDISEWTFLKCIFPRPLGASTKTW